LAPLECRKISVERTIEILRLLDVFIDDRPDINDVWMNNKLAGLPDQIQVEVWTWIRARRGQLPRTRRKDESTIRNNVQAVRPMLFDWARQHQSLREITRDRVREAIVQLTGVDLKLTLTALKSLFSTLKRRKVIFRNPTAGFRIGTIADTLRPISDEDLVAVAEAARDPTRRLLFLLAALHAARSAHIRRLLLTDIDLERLTITIGGHARPVDRLTYAAIMDYLEHRRGRWPLCANPHLLVTQQTAYESGPVSINWTKTRFRGLTGTLTQLRQTRYFEELIAQGPDPLRLRALFGVSTDTAIRYANAASHMLRSSLGDTTDPPELPTEFGPAAQA
jgi:integrase